MSLTLYKHALVAALITATSSPAISQITRQEIDSPVGKLQVENGFPTRATVMKLYDNLDFGRGVEAYMWSLPFMAMAQWQRVSRETFGAGNLDYVDYLDFKDKLGLLTANATTPYAHAFPNLAEQGPLVFVVPPGATAGGILDFWERPITDTGQTGPDKGKGGKYLILGPNDPDMQPEGYYVFRSSTNNIWSGQRALDPDPAKVKEVIAGFNIYPYSQRDNPPAAGHVSSNGKKWKGTQPRGMDYWQLLAKTIDGEPVQERDRLMMAMLVPLGIEKGKPFRPDARQTKILTQAVEVGELTARANSYAKRFPGSIVWTGRQWEYALFLKQTNQELPDRTQLDERASWFYEAVGVTDGMMGKIVGAGQVFLESQRDAGGEWLDGGKHYSLHVPPDAPVVQFWSVTVYDNESRTLIDAGSYPERSSRNDIVKNADGSVDLHFGPVPPQGKPRSNWIKTLPGKGWFTYFRLYGPTQAYFKKTWVLPDIQQILEH